MIHDERTGLTWDVRPHPEVEGAVDLVCWDSGDAQWKLQCIPVSVLEQLVEKAKELQP
jgi:hypothetical protein